MEKRELDRIKQLSSAVKRKREMFKTWLRTSENPTWRKLVEALRKIDFPAAERVEEMYNVHIPTVPSHGRDGEDREARPDSGVESPDEDSGNSQQKCGYFVTYTPVNCDLHRYV